MLVIVNGSANGGQGSARWQRVEEELRGRGIPFEVRPTESAEDAQRAVDDAIRAGHRELIAAGGDGTVNGVLNALMDPTTDRPRADVALGAIGLGSSNDFHKPFSPQRTIGKIPVRLSGDNAPLVDVGKAIVTDRDGTVRTRYFILNGSMGLVAAGNAFFNSGDPTLLRLKRFNVELAILYTAWVNLRRFKPIAVTVKMDDQPAKELEATSLGILKKVHFAGGMRYDTPVTADDGMFDVNIWEPMGKLATVGTMAALYRGKFTGRKRTQAHRARRVELKMATRLDFELDGEVTQAIAADLVVLPRVLRACE
ncbi:MAG: hypothetical protein HY698_00165 [Deltaproteobacteria bacterium]|nr:hypothetical protein [Deltaproteobacteria bacterium]